MDNIILVEGGLIVGLGILYSIQNNRPLTPVFAGSIGLLLIVSLMDLFGGGWSIMARAMLSLATFTVLTAEGGNLLSGVQTAINRSSK